MAEDPNLIERDGPAVGEPALEGIVIDWRKLEDQAELTLEEWRERALYAEERLEKLSERVATLSRLVFGESSEQSRTRAKSKKPTPDPGDGDPGDPTDQDNDSAGDDPNGGEPAAGGSGRGQKRGGRGHGRRDYSHIQTREVIHDVPEEQRRRTCCGREYKFLGSESSDRIDWEVLITRVVHRRLRYHKECTCPGNRTVIGPPAPEPIAKGMFTAGFLGHLIYDKYVLGLPLQRIVRGLSAEGFDVAEGTLCGALKNVAGLLEPVADAIITRNRAAVHVHADETTWRVFADEEADTGRRWWLWVVRREVAAV
jgi:transposase